MKLWLCLLLLSLVAVSSVRCQDSSGEDGQDPATPGGESWWSRFKQRVKEVMSRWRDDIRLLWSDVLSKADDMKGWTSEMFDSFKKKFREWLETRVEVPDDEKNEIESFIDKLKVPTERPARTIDP